MFLISPLTLRSSIIILISLLKHQEFGTLIIVCDASTCLCFFFPLSCLLAGYVSLRFLGTLCMCSLLALLPQLLKHFKAFTCIIIFGAMNSVELRLLFFRGWIYFVYYMLGYYRKCVHLALGFVKMKALYFWPFGCIC